MLLGAALSVQTLHAQNGGAGVQEEGVVPVFTGGTELVVLHVTVADKNDRIVPDLKQEDFQIFENGVAQEIRQFRREDVPVSVGIVVDNSGSMRDKRLKVNAAAVDFVKASNPDDEVFIVNSMTTPTSTVPSPTTWTACRTVCNGLIRGRYGDVSCGRCRSTISTRRPSTTSACCC